MKSKKKLSVEEQLQSLLYEQYREEFNKYQMQFIDYFSFDGVQVKKLGYLNDNEYDDWKEEKWKQFLHEKGWF